MTTIKYKGVNIVTLKPYSAQQISLWKKKKSNTLIVVIERKIVTQTKNRGKVSKFNFLWGLRGKNNQYIRFAIIS